MFLTHMTLLFLLLFVHFSGTGGFWGPADGAFDSQVVLPLRAWPRSCLGRFFCLFALGYPLVNLIEQTGEPTEAIASRAYESSPVCTSPCAPENGDQKH